MPAKPETEKTEPAAPAPAEPPAAAAGPSTAELSTKVDRLTGLVEDLLSKGHAAGQGAVEHRLDNPSVVAQQVQAALDERDRRDKLSGLETGLAAISETVQKVTEVKPEDPPRRIHRLMGWGK